MLPETGNNNESGAEETASGETPAVTVVVAQPEPSEDAEGESDDAEAIAAISERIASLEGRVTEAVTGDDTWQTATTLTITSLQQEVANLKATLATVAETMPGQVNSLQEQLTLLSQELRQARETPAPGLEAEVPPAVPPMQAAPSGEVAEGQETTDRRPAPHAKKKGRRVV